MMELSFGMSLLLTLVIGIASLIITVPLLVRSAKRNKLLAEQTASMLGLEYLNVVDELQEYAHSADNSFSSEDDSVRLLGNPSREQVKKALNSPLVSGLMINGMPWKMLGDYNGRKICIRPIVDAGGEHRQHFIQFRVYFSQPLPFAIVVCREGVLEIIGKGLGVLTDIKIDNPDFDSTFLIKGQDEPQVMAWLKSATRQEVILNLAKRYSRLRVDEKGLQYEQKGRTIEYETFRGVLDALTQGTKSLE